MIIGTIFRMNIPGNKDHPWESWFSLDSAKDTFSLFFRINKLLSSSPFSTTWSAVE